MQELENSFEILENYLKTRKRKYIPLTDGFKQAAVLIPIIPFKNHISLIFVKRTSNVTHHKGEISFPGGKFDEKSDDTIISTALRELNEEVGLDDVKVLGCIDDITTISKYVVTPVIGIINKFSKVKDLKIDCNEVDYVIKVPLAFFLNDNNLQIKDINFNDKRYDVPFFYFNDEIIWGATGRIILNLNKIIKEISITF